MVRSNYPRQRSSSINKSQSHIKLLRTAAATMRTERTSLSKMKTAAVLLLGHLSPLASAWGALGHETVAWIAQSSVSSTTASAIKGILDNKQSDYMANVSTWADSYRYTSAGRWSAPLHFIDANDNPPSSCSMNYSRDCGDSGCSISAIINQLRYYSTATRVNLSNTMR